MTLLYPIAIAFLTGGFGKLAELHLMDPNLALAIGTVAAGVLGRLSAKHDPNKGKAPAPDQAAP